jgi:hypothetical protein
MSSITDETTPTTRLGNTPSVSINNISDNNRKIKKTNPYYKIKKQTIKNKITLSEEITTINTELENEIEINEIQSQLNDNIAFGDSLLKKSSLHTRLFFQNINSLQPRNMNKWQQTVKWCVDQEIDICGLAETCVNFQEGKTKNEFKKSAMTIMARAGLTTSDNSSPCDSKY